MLLVSEGGVGHFTGLSFDNVVPACYCSHTSRDRDFDAGFALERVGARIYGHIGV